MTIGWCQKPRVSPKTASDDDLESGDEAVPESGTPGSALDAWSLTFEDKALEAEYLASHMALMRTAPRLYAIPLFTMFAAVMNVLLIILLPHEGRALPKPMILGVFLSPTSYAGVLIENKFGGRGFAVFSKAMQFIMAMFLIIAAWQPFFQQMYGACESDIVANCALLQSGLAPYPALLLVTVTPMILTVVFGMQWLPVLSVFVMTNAPAMYYILSYQKVEIHVCIITFITTTTVAVITSWVHIRQERETFVWRKVALSEKAVELERTVMCPVTSCGFAITNAVFFHSSMRSCVTKFGIRLR
jgi:hypothetical protein